MLGLILHPFPGLPGSSCIMSLISFKFESSLELRAPLSRLQVSIKTSERYHRRCCIAFKRVAGTGVPPRRGRSDPAPDFQWRGKLTESRVSGQVQVAGGNSCRRRVPVTQIRPMLPSGECRSVAGGECRRVVTILTTSSS